MTEEAKLRIAALRWSHSHEDCTDANDTCPVYDECFRLNSVLCNLRTVADLIESLSEQLEQVTRERNAAVMDIEQSPITLCDVCVHYHTGFPCSGGNFTDKINITIACSKFKWRGVEVE